MLINADFTRRATLAIKEFDWVASPQAGVQRVMLDRVGEEKARATSIVRYAPDSHFPRHQHPGGEEILVLSGIFSDDEGHYPEGWYLRNPPGSNHQPFSEEGATIFVKLRQMPAEEDRQVRIDTGDPASWQRDGDREVCRLFSSDYEQVCMQRLEAGKTVFSQPVNGAELLVVAGCVTLDELPYPKGSWIRLPADDYPALCAGAQGVTLYIKTGHIRRSHPFRLCQNTSSARDTRI